MPVTANDYDTCAYIVFALFRIGPNSSLMFCGIWSEFSFPLFLFSYIDFINSLLRALPKDRRLDYIICAPELECERLYFKGTAIGDSQTFGLGESSYSSIVSFLSTTICMFLAGLRCSLSSSILKLKIKLLFLILFFIDLLFLKHTKYIQ